jgi:hypothetical protein
VTTPAAPAVPAAPTTPAAPANPVWGAGGTPAPASTFGGTVAGRVGPAVNNALANLGPSNFELVPGRYPDAIGLPQLLNQLSASPQGKAVVEKLLGDLSARTGVPVSPEMKAAILANPNAITRAFEMTPAALFDGIAALNAAHKAGKIPPTPPRENLLPKSFDLGKLESFNLPRPETKLKELAPGLYQGSLPSETSDAQVKSNRVLAEVFHRLSRNASAADGDKFEVKYGSHTFTRLDEFMKELKKDGYEVNVTFEQRIANFADLKAAVPGTNPPKFVDVPATLMVKTGFVDANGKEAIVPSAHSEMLISVKSGANTKGPRFDADIKYYQGVDSTGFFARNLWQEPKWCGRVKHAELTGDKAQEAIKLAGLFSDVVGKTAKDLGLYAEGYGLTGVCNDSVALIEQAMTGTAHEYPLLMKDEVLLGEVQKRLADNNRRDDPSFRKLGQAIRDLPSDLKSGPTTRQRALDSMPWEAGKEPFQSSVDARAILSN